MRFIRFLLIISLFLQPICSAQQEIVAERNIMGQTKDAACKIMQWGKNGCKCIFSHTAPFQYCFIFPELFTQLIFGMVNYELYNILETKIPSTPFAELPMGVKNALIDMHAQDVSIKAFDYDNARATLSKTIFMGKDFPSRSDAIQRFITGHEVVHIQQHHVKKSLALLMICLGGFVCAEKIVSKIDERLEKMDKDTYTYTSLLYFKNAFCFIKNNPLIAYIALMTTLAYYNRSCEKEADMIAATTLNCAQGGIDYFRHALIDEQMDIDTIATEETATSFWTLYFRFFSFLGSTLNWKAHPSLETRIDYLLPLAEQQALAAQASP